MPHETLNDGPAIAAGREYVGFFFEWWTCKFLWIQIQN
jgi:hypothetical protein